MAEEYYTTRIKIENEENSADEMDASNNTLNVQAIEENPDNAVSIKKENNYFSIKKSLNVDSVPSAITVVNSGSSSNDNVIYSCNICPQSSLNPHLFALHMSTHEQSGTNTCRVCDETFRTVHLWEKHLEYHQERVSSCYQICPPQVETAVDITPRPVTRKRRARKPRPLPCKHCKKPFTEKWKLLEHYRTKHSDSENEDTPQQPATNAIQNIEQVNGSNVVPILTNGKKKNWVCDMCEEEFNRSSSLMCHRRSHYRNNPYYPEEDGYEYIDFGDEDSSTDGENDVDERTQN